MMSTQKNLIAVCCAAVLAFGLAACGSSSDDDKVPVTGTGGGGDTMTPPDATTTPPDATTTPSDMACDTSATSQGCVDEKKMVMDEAKEALDAAKADENSTQKQIADAQKAYDDAKMAHMTAMEGRNTYLAMQPSTYDAKAMATAFDNVAAMLGGGLTTGNTVDDTVRGGKVTVNNLDRDNTYAKATWPVPTITGWAGSVWERSDSPTDSVVVYTNIQDAANAKYNTYYVVGNVPVADSGWAYKLRAGVGSVAAQKTGGELDPNKPNVIILAKAVGTAHELYSAKMLPTGNGNTKTYPDGDENEAENQVEFAGSFNGVMGMFMCSADICSAATNDDGELETLIGTWTFTADSKDAMVAGVLVDADYLDFGYWVNTDDSGADTEYVVNTFFRGEDPYGDVKKVVGSAIYKGAAAGLYTKRALTPGGDGDVTAAGRFTADAELMAYFGQPAKPNDNLPPNMVKSISGMIKNFMDGDMMIDAAWLVELNKIQGNKFNAKDSQGTEGTFTGGTTGGGTWRGTFYGDPGDPNANAHPTGVAGEFDAVFNNGDVIGSFGATKTKK